MGRIARIQTLEHRRSILHDLERNNRIGLVHAEHRPRERLVETVFVVGVEGQTECLVIFVAKWFDRCNCRLDQVDEGKSVVFLKSYVSFGRVGAHGNVLGFQILRNGSRAVVSENSHSLCDQLRFVGIEGGKVQSRHGESVS